MTQRLATGRIVWAEIADANGIRKLRPAVIVTPTDHQRVILLVEAGETLPVPSDRGVALLSGSA